MRDSKMLLRLLRLQLQSDPPCRSRSWRLLSLQIHARPRATQGGLFLPPSPDPQKLELTLARLANLVGDANIGSPHLLDTHRPDAFQMHRFVPSRDDAKTQQDNAVLRLRLSAGFRTFRPAPPATVELREGRPVRVSFRGMRGEVVAASGPWRTSGDWWRKDAWHQDEWDLEIRFRRLLPMSAASTPARIGLYRLYFDALQKAGSCAESTIELCRTARALRIQLSRRRFDARRTWRCVRRTRNRRHGAARSRRRLRRAAFLSGCEKTRIRAHIGAEVTSADGWRYALLAESRTGYQNLCRLITHMKLRAPKGQGCVSPEEVAEARRGLICLTGGDEGPLAHALAIGGIASRQRMRSAALRTIRP